jgi:predicted alpha/beta-fold hydrolase
LKHDTPYRAPAWLPGGHAQTIYPLARRGWAGAVPHFRGCSGALNRLPRAYHSGDSAEIDWLPQRLLAFFGHTT